MKNDIKTAFSNFISTVCWTISGAFFLTIFYLCFSPLAWGFKEVSVPVLLEVSCYSGTLKPNAKFYTSGTEIKLFDVNKLYFINKASYVPDSILKNIGYDIKIVQSILRPRYINFSLNIDDVNKNSEYGVIAFPDGGGIFRKIGSYNELLPNSQVPKLEKAITVSGDPTWILKTPFVLPHDSDYCEPNPI